MCNLYFIIFLLVSLSLFFLGLYFLNLDLEIFLELNLLSFNSCSVEMVLFLDWISLTFMSFVMFISSMIIKYSDEYMLGDKNLKRFIVLMILFVFSMMMMILSSNLISILLGWDGLGLVSYVLVIYYQNEKSYNAGMLTALSNRIGDAALLMSIAWMMNFGGWNFIFYLDMLKNNFIMMIVSLFIVLAAITKSAQIPFSSWLPAAMAAPTPVSSLVHSSTLVTAGVYLLFRFSPSFSNELMNFLLFGSLFTMFMAGLAANFEYDLKKIIALSTLSQLGMMITILCLGDSSLAFFHLLIHALFKALLFMCAGAIIHNFSNCQDIRYMGGLTHFMPLTCSCLNISNFALCGLPFLSGFYSKDLIAEVASMGHMNIFIYLVFYLSIGLTVSYSMRLSYYVFFGDFNFLALNYFNDSNNKIMLKGMMGLVLLVIFKGSMLMWVLFPTPYFIMLPFSMKLMTLIMIMMGGILGYELSCVKYYYEIKSLMFLNLTTFFSGMWNMPILSTYGINSYFLNLGKIYYKFFDQGWIEYYGSKKLSSTLSHSSQILQLLSRNHLKFYLLVIFMFVLFILFMF
uniref:NADH-ubiquinone oxidoreductase chain 5 n=1 Tax=Larinus turbinatus TaxID=202011 RepID=J9PIS9_9CUCU|nr:NADH dehydrogenase subunit 5 [Larinus turbinatus]